MTRDKAGQECARCAALDLVSSFNAGAFAEPEAWHWPGYFWLWNDDLDPEILRAQLRDMASHGARSVVMLPMPHAFRPDSTNNAMDPDYLTPGFFARVRLAVAEAARLGMHWWLYDEAGWPSGQAGGRVVAGHPELRAQRLVRRHVAAGGPYVVPADAVALVVEKPGHQVFAPGETWEPGPGNARAYLYSVAASDRADLLNPEVTERFIAHTHESYRSAVGTHFGTTVRLVFTDEPAVTSVHPPEWITWTGHLAALYQERYGRDIRDDLPHLFAQPQVDMPLCAARARVDFFDLWTTRFQETYFAPLRTWCRRHHLAAAGHLGGEDETLGAVRHGFGHALRQLRAMDVPGVDLIWGQLMPGRPRQHHFPKFASSAAHQNGTRFSFTESFAVYGNGLTPAQMKWLVDYQFVRGINMLVGACYPLGTRDHQMTGERPHFGRCNPLWDHMHPFHAYSARLGQCLSAGAPDISVALYYPVRDLWAWGEASPAAVAHDELAAELLARQVDFDLIDDDALVSADVDHGELIVGSMRYTAVVCGVVNWMQPQALRRLRGFAAAGGGVLCAGQMPGTAGAPDTRAEAFQLFDDPAALAATIRPTAVLEPRAADIRVAARRMRNGHLFMLFNEGTAEYNGHLCATPAYGYRLDPATGSMERLDGGARGVHVVLAAGAAVLLVFSEEEWPATAPLAATEDVLELDTVLTAVPRRRFQVGAHDFERVEMTAAAVPFAAGRLWRTWLGEDFSGEVEYRAAIDIPAAWGTSPLRLETGPVEYAATVLLDGAPAGELAWAPWHLDLPPCAPGRHELVVRVANTLANELASSRVAEEWSRRTGLGWPGPYHERALEFERRTRGGGLPGPVRLRRLRSR